MIKKQTPDTIQVSDIINREEIKSLLMDKDPATLNDLCEQALHAKREFAGDKVYLRGLVEISNVCRKNCFYCGIRRHNTHINRYLLDKKEVLDAAQFAHENNFGSLVIQSGERTDKEFIRYIDELLREIHQITNNSLGITLSLGEQSPETYARWFASGAHRYLLRIETSNEQLYYKLHPKDSAHSFKNRLKALESIKKTGFQTGTGVMIGLPFQTPENLVDDLLFFRDFGVDMVGMGPYVEHSDTPMYNYRHLLPGEKERFELTLKMIALLRIMMPYINIASTTALETLSENGRLLALQSGANVFMPNLTPDIKNKDYFLYDGKPVIKGNIMAYLENFNKELNKSDQKIGFGEKGNSRQYMPVEFIG